jgi:hypothetical protein
LLILILGKSGAMRMCLLCEELWMPFELPPEAKARTFVADAPEPDRAAGQTDRTGTRPGRASSSGDGEPSQE